MKKTAAVLCPLLVVLAAAAPASAQSVLNRDHVLGLGVQASFPYDELGEDNGTGWGLFATLDYPLIPLLDLTARAGRNSFPGEGDAASVDVWEISAGGRLALGAFFMGGEAGWYDRGEEWSWVPSIGLRYTRIEVSVRWRSVGRNAYTGLGAAWYF